MKKLILCIISFHVYSAQDSVQLADTNIQDKLTQFIQLNTLKLPAELFEEKTYLTGRHRNLLASDFTALIYKSNPSLQGKSISEVFSFLQKFQITNEFKKKWEQRNYDSQYKDHLYSFMSPFMLCSNCCTNCAIIESDIKECNDSLLRRYQIASLILNDTSLSYKELNDLLKKIQTEKGHYTMFDERYFPGIKSKIYKASTDTQITITASLKDSLLIHHMNSSSQLGHEGLQFYYNTFEKKNEITLAALILYLNNMKKKQIHLPGITRTSLIQTTSSSSKNEQEDDNTMHLYPNNKDFQTALENYPHT